MTNTENYKEMQQSINVAEEMLASEFIYSNQNDLDKASNDLKNIMTLYPTSINCTALNDELRQQILISSSESEFLIDSLSGLK
jgi:hypothetical protein